MHPQEFMQRLAALVPRPRLHLIRFDGVLAPHAKLRAAGVPDVMQPASEIEHKHAHGQAARMSWARLLKRVFDIERTFSFARLRSCRTNRFPAERQVINLLLTDTPRRSDGSTGRVARIDRLTGFRVKPLVK